MTTSIACHQCGEEPRRRGFSTCQTCSEATQSSTAPVCPEPTRFYDDSPSEPDWESILEDRAEARREYEEDRAQDRYDRSVYGD